MKKLHKLLFVGAIASSLSAGSIAYAQSIRTLGDTWNDDYGVGYAYSHYQHDYNNHGAKVVNSNNGVQNFKNAGPGVWAKASIGDLWDPATFYYNPSGFYSN
ncbi:lactococcin 972 family bacteriocin [Streptococcus halichoeri]|uniref:lactococcin 972 family bacteriocin n=1 Tax=Streptococcus halichoeri TaxID=254785 RepID=UPI00135CA032|nr:lactococcin 972 family bacteriocin [Streptococcus halichoeri]